MALNPIAVYAQYIGGKNSLYNITAAQVVKASPGVLYSVCASAPGSAGVLTLNDSNALITNQTITAVTQAASGVATLSTGGGSNPFAVGNTITFASIVGMTQLNGLVGTVTAIGGTSGAWTVTFNINTTAFTAYASGGTASSFGVGNQINSYTFTQLGSINGATGLIDLSWPCQNGILVSVVPSAGSPIISATYF